MRISTAAAAVTYLAIAIVSAAAFAATPAWAGGVSWRLTKMQQLEAAAAKLRDDPVANPRIVGGTNAAVGKWPFQVALLRTGFRNNFNAEWCGGSLVDQFHVITAAHCVFGMQEADFRVLSGTQTLESGGTRHKLARITVHPNYNDATLDFDIAVITLTTPAAVSFYSTLITQAQETTLAAPRTTSYVIGWGNRMASGGSYPETLQQVAVPLVSRGNCNDANSYDGEITPRMICAGVTAGGKDSCDGDSGGPLMVRDAQGRWRLQAGIVSWGDGCAQANFYGVYSRVAVLSAWAKRVISGNAALVATLDCARLAGDGQRLCQQTRARKQ